MTSAEALAALKAHDQMLPERAAAAPATLPEDVVKALPLLDNESKLLAVAVIEKQNAPSAATVLLQLTNEDTQVAAAAARALLTVKASAPVADLLAAIPHRDEPIVRGFLYLAVGKSGDNTVLDKLRPLAAAEKDRDAREEAQVAAVKLAGKPERTAFINRIHAAGADEALRIQDQLLYVNDVNLAKALLPWLGKEDPVFRLGSDRANQADKMARMKDLAVWIAFRLGVKFKITPEHIANFDPAVIAECSRALSGLHD